MFLYNAGTRQESKTTRVFRQVAAPGAKYAVSDCILFRHAVSNH